MQEFAEAQSGATAVLVDELDAGDVIVASYEFDTGHF